MIYVRAIKAKNSSTAAEQLIINSLSFITRIIDLLVTAKYIKRSINTEDKRKSNLSITTLGLAIIDKASPIVNNYKNAALKGIGITKEDHVKAVIKTIINNCK